MTKYQKLNPRRRLKAAKMDPSIPPYKFVLFQFICLDALPPFL
jgi:hypothetical protein